MPLLLAEGAVRVRAFRTVLAKPPVPQKRQVRLADGLLRQAAEAEELLGELLEFVLELAVKLVHQPNLPVM